MSHRSVCRLLTIVAVVVAAAPLAAQNPAESWYGRMGAKSKDFDPLKTYSGSFQIELPKEWQLVAGHSGTLFSAAEKTKRSQPAAAIVLEHRKLQAAIPADVLTTFGAELLKEVQTAESSGTGFSQQAVKVGDQAFVLIQYDRPGVAGWQDHIVDYAFPVGTTLYHLICIAPKDVIDKYRPIFAYTAASFVPVKTGS